MIRVKQTEGEQMHYRVADAGNPYEAIVASFAMKVAVAELKIEAPKLCFVQNTIKSCADLETREDIIGLARGGGKQIFVRTGLDHKNLVDTIFHECRHAMQFQRGITFNREHRERDARIYALELMTKIGDPPEWRVLEFLTKKLNEKGL